MTTDAVSSSRIAANAHPKATVDRGRFSGFTNLFRKEMSAWWNTKTWWIQAALFLVACVGIPAAAAFQMKAAGELSTNTMEAYLVFLMLHMIFSAGSAIITVQGAIVGEKEAGTAAWILSKPVSRASFIGAKALALSINFLVTAVAVPAAAIIVVWGYLGIAPSPSAVAVMLAGMCLTVLFYLLMTLFLGVVFGGRAAIAGSAFGVFFVLTQFGQQAPDLTPAGIPFRTIEALQGGGLVSVAPFVIAAVASGVFLLFAVLRFRADEL